MAQTIDVQDIVGLSEIALRTGSTKQAVWNWTRREGFPDAITRVSGRPVWDWSEVEQWDKNWVRGRGGFPTHKKQEKV